MRTYNDYEIATYHYLTRYEWIRARIKSLDLEITDKTAELHNFGGAKVPSYTEQVGHGQTELNETERGAEQLGLLRDTLHRLNTDRRSAVNLLSRLDEVIATLSENEKIVVQRKYIAGYSWMQVAREMGYSERNCQRWGRKAIQRIAFSLFGQKAEQGSKQFVFLSGVS